MGSEADLQRRARAIAVMDPVGGLAHIIQTALTPVFLLSGIGTLLQLFNARLARVAKSLARAADLVEQAAGPAEQRRLRRHLAGFARRMWLLDAAIALGAVGAAASCGAASILFLGSIRNSAEDGWLIGLFATALGCTVASLVVFLGDSVLAWMALRGDGPLAGSIRSGAQRQTRDDAP